MAGFLRLGLLMAGDHMIVAGAERSFPSGYSKREDMLEFVMVRLMRREHGPSQHSKAACRIDGRA